MNDMLLRLGRWQLDVKAVRERMYGAPTPRERERWHALWLWAQGWTAAQMADALECDLPYHRRMDGRYPAERCGGASL